jgi:hypothetical protein
LLADFDANGSLDSSVIFAWGITLQLERLDAVMLVEQTPVGQGCRSTLVVSQRPKRAAVLPVVVGRFLRPTAMLFPQ